MGKFKLMAIALGRLLYELDLFRVKRAKRNKEQRADEIKQDPNHVAAERFGDPAGRVRVDHESD
ncbi:hypothetical protein [Vibrio furnissii]|uniref:hypothetical protein n=1 Tax=Vibrio furnissii TaxID=29494 RepID=UPI001EEB6196|nr:hypothetical protein [Vibrio furnissii]MCG6268300.1 hypothetical protein [Vibrio furnissii]